MHKYSNEFLKAIPKTDLHVHLDGSLRLNTLIELAKAKSIPLPAYTEDGLREKVFRKSYKSLDEYLEGFTYTCSVMQDAESLERIAYELAIDSFSEGVRYIEVRFAPQLHMSREMSFEDVMHSVDIGLKKARTEINNKIMGHEPLFEFGIIVCAMRFCNMHFSKFYNDFFQIHKYSSEKEIIRQLSNELAIAAVQLKNNSIVQIVGFDLAGSEDGFPADNHRSSYDYVHENFMMKTVHAGEAYGAESIFQAITKLHADRIGHGLFLFEKDKIFSPDIKDKDKYISDLSNYIAEKRITLEVCLTSNLQTVPEIKSIKEHPIGKMLENKISVSLCTDNRLVSNTTVTDEIILALENFDISPDQLKDMIVYGFKRSFFYKPYHSKREYVRSMIDYYEMLEKKYLLKKS